MNEPAAIHPVPYAPGFETPEDDEAQTAECFVERESTAGSCSIRVVSTTHVLALLWREDDKDHDQNSYG